MKTADGLTTAENWITQFWLKTNLFEWNVGISRFDSIEIEPPGGGGASALGFNGSVNVEEADR